MSIKGNAVELYGVTKNTRPIYSIRDLIINKAMIRKVFMAHEPEMCHYADNEKELLESDIGSTVGIEVLLKHYGDRENITYPVSIYTTAVFIVYGDKTTEVAARQSIIATQDDVLYEPYDVDLDAVFKSMCRQLDGYSSKRENDGWASR